MKKKLLSLLGLLFFVISCQEEQAIIRHDQIVVKDGRLVFDDLEHFSKILINLNEGAETPDINVVDGRLQNLNYTSYYSTLVSAISDTTQSDDHLRILDIFGFQVLLNSNLEFQAGDKIYRISNDRTWTYSRDGILLDENSNTIERISAKNTSNEISGRTNAIDGEVYSGSVTSLHTCDSPISIQYTWQVEFYKVAWGPWDVLYTFYARIKLIPGLLTPSPGPTSYDKAEYFKFMGSLCLECQLPSSPPPLYTYNVSSVTYALGFMARHQYETRGTLLSVGCGIKPICRAFHAVGIP